MTHSLMWLTETATPDMMSLIGTAMLKGVDRAELHNVLDCVENYILSDGREGSRELELLYSRYDISRKPDIASLYFNLKAKGANDEELNSVLEYYYGFVIDKYAVTRLRKLYMN